MASTKGGGATMSVGERPAPYMLAQPDSALEACGGGRGSRPMHARPPPQPPSESLLPWRASPACACGLGRDCKRPSPVAQAGAAAAAVAAAGRPASPSPGAASSLALPAGADADTLLRQYVQEALSSKANGGSTKLYDQ